MVNKWELKKRGIIAFSCIALLTLSLLMFGCVEQGKEAVAGKAITDFNEYDEEKDKANEAFEWDDATNSCQIPYYYEGKPCGKKLKPNWLTLETGCFLEGAICKNQVCVEIACDEQGGQKLCDDDWDLSPNEYDLDCAKPTKQPGTENYVVLFKQKGYTWSDKYWYNYNRELTANDVCKSIGDYICKEILYKPLGEPIYTEWTSVGNSDCTTKFKNLGGILGKPEANLKVVCEPKPDELCNNGLDEDKDNEIDCNDYECLTTDDCKVPTISTCPQSMVSYWQFEAGKDDETGTNPFVATGQLPSLTEGMVGKATTFFGPYYFKVADSNSLDLKDEFTIEFWMYAKDKTKRQHLLSKYDHTKNKRAYSIDITENGNIRMEVGKADGTYSGAVEIASSYWNTDQWNHVVFTFSSGTLKAYINSIPPKQKTGLTSPIGVNDLPLLIGKYPVEGVSETFNGKIDELAIYNQKLSGGTIKDHFLISKYGKNHYCKYEKPPVTTTTTTATVSTTTPTSAAKPTVGKR